MRERFHSIYSHGIIRAAVCLPSLRVADPVFNAERTLALANQASRAQAAVALFPELGISAYTNDDLFHQDALLDASRAAVAARDQRERRPDAGAGGRRAPAVRGEAVQLRGRDLSRAGVGPGAQDLSAQLPRVLRETAVRLRPRCRPAARCASWASACRFGNDSCSRRPTSRASRSTRRFARTSGRRSRRALTRRWRARRCWPTFRPATSPSARPNTGATSARPSRASASPRTSIRAPAQASPPPTSPGTGMR